MRRGRRRRAILALLLIALLAALYGPIGDLVLAGRMMLAVRTLASDSPEPAVGVEAAVERRTMGNRTVEAVVYRRTGATPQRAIVLVAGVSPLGCFHPRLVALARMLAAMGFVVVTPDMTMFRRLEVNPAVLDELAFWTRSTPAIAGSTAATRPAGIIGISFSGTLALITAAQPDLRDGVAFVLAIGPYEDLARVARGWFAPGPATVEPGRYPTRAYGKWLVMLQAVSALPERDRAPLEKTLRGLLLSGTAPPQPPELGTEARRWYRFALARETESDPELVRTIEVELTRYYERMSPAAAAAAVPCPVFLAHGAFDDLIPADESRRLAERMGGKARLLVTPFLTHTHPLERPLGWGEKLGALSGMVPFFYSVARAAR